MKTHLVFAVMTLALLLFVISQTNRRTLTFDDVIRQARELSLQPFEPREPTGTKALREANYDELRDVRYKGDAMLWRDKGLPFQVSFFIAGGAHGSTPVTVFQVNRDGAKWVPYDPDLFAAAESSKLKPADLEGAEFSGFRVYYPLNKSDHLDETLVFQGASYYRPLARGQTWGISARGICVDTLGKEEFPAFTTFWLVEPTPGSNELLIYALLDGPSVTGAYEFRVQPGDETRIRVHAMLFPRKNVKDVGFAPLTSMYWFGENTSNTFGDFRPEVHDSDGLQILHSSGEWIWRPLAWAQQRQINIYADTDPGGFGLFQRDRDFSHYQDLEANYHQRPSVWIQPEGDWGAGEVVLMQNPTDSEYVDNVVAYWRPKDGLEKGRAIELKYTTVAFTENAGLPPIGRCVSTRIDYQNEKYFRKIFIDFAGGELAALPEDANLKPVISAGEGGEISHVRLQKNPNDNTWRLAFTVSTSNSHNPVEMRCALVLDDRPVTETWDYTWVK